MVALVPGCGSGAGGDGGGVRPGVPGAVQGGAQQGRGGTTNEIRLYIPHFHAVRYQGGLFTLYTIVMQGEILKKQIIVNRGAASVL